LFELDHEVRAMLAQPANRVNGARPEIKNGCLRLTCTFSGEIFIVKAALLRERLEVVVPRVENLPSFVLWKLRRFLHFVQNRVEVGRRGQVWVPGEREIEGTRG
jgi:hypothetical protein